MLDEAATNLFAALHKLDAAGLEAYGRRYAGDLVERGKRILGER
jgi:hypothetical protein